MQLTDWITQLKSQCPSLFNRVYGAAELAVLDKAVLGQTPSVYVVPMTEQAKSRIVGANYTDNTLITVAIVTTVRNVADTRGDSAHHQLEPVRLEIKAALWWLENSRDDESRAVYPRPSRQLRQPAIALHRLIHHPNQFQPTH